LKRSQVLVILVLSISIVAASTALYPIAHGNGHGEYTETWTTSSLQSETMTETGEPSKKGGGLVGWVKENPWKATAGVIVAGAIATITVTGLAVLTAKILTGTITSKVLIALIIASPLDEMVYGLAAWGLSKLFRKSSGPYVPPPKIFEGQEEVKSSSGIPHWVCK